MRAAMSNSNLVIRKSRGSTKHHVVLESRNTKKAWETGDGQDPILTFRLAPEFTQAIDRWRSTEQPWVLPAASL
jgi:hypothetical protein